MRQIREQIISYVLCFIFASLIGLAYVRIMAPSFGFAEESQPSSVAAPASPATNQDQARTLRGSGDLAPSLQSQPVTVHELVHFIGIDGDDLLVQPGTYSLGAAGESTLKLISSGQSRLIQARTIPCVLKMDSHTSPAAWRPAQPQGRSERNGVCSCEASILRWTLRRSTETV